MNRHATSRLLASLVLLGCWIALPLSQAAEPARKAGEYELKAVFLYNFTRFVDWPETAFTNREAPFVIAVYGDDPFGKALDDALAGETIRNRKLLLKRVRGSEPVPLCHLLFVSRSEQERLKEIALAVNGRPTLLVSDVPQGAERGAMVNFIVRDSVRMEINQSLAEAAGLRISSKLLGIATIVRPAGAGKKQEELR